LGIDINKSLVDLTTDDKWKQSFRFWMEHDEKINSYRVCSFSSNPESVLMWSYYGAGHSGMCLELNLSEYEKDIHEVKYVSDIKETDRSSIKSLLTCKLDVWKHENEYRWISNGEASAKYLRANIKAVLLGAGMDTKYFRPFLEICAVMNLQIDIVSFNTSGQLHRFPLKKGVRWDDIA